MFIVEAITGLANVFVGFIKTSKRNDDEMSADIERVPWPCGMNYLF